MEVQEASKAAKIESKTAAARAAAERATAALDLLKRHVGDEGISLPNLRKIIEVDFLGGSRRQEAQRVGRLLHATAPGKHVVLMTREEFYAFERRFYALEEKGFKVTVRMK